MELVVKIPDNYNLDEIKNGSIASKVLLETIKNGIPLPKGHGRLIDADELFLDIQTDTEERLCENLGYVWERITAADTLVEADT